DRSEDLVGAVNFGVQMLNLAMRCKKTPGLEPGVFLLQCTLGYQPRICFRSPSAVPIGAMLKFSTRKLSTLGVMKAGSDGPILMFLIPRCSRVSRMATAFCSYQER